MTNKYWEVKEIVKTNDSKTMVSVKLKDVVNDSYEAIFKWDGCIDMFEYANGYTPDDAMTGKEIEDNVDYIHICEIDDMIARLNELKSIMQEFGVNKK
jgi:hypothetical protein